MENLLPLLARIDFDLQPAQIEFAFALFFAGRGFHTAEDGPDLVIIFCAVFIGIVSVEALSNLFVFALGYIENENNIARFLLIHSAKLTGLPRPGGLKEKIFLLHLPEV